MNKTELAVTVYQVNRRSTARDARHVVRPHSQLIKLKNRISFRAN